MSANFIVQWALKFYFNCPFWKITFEEGCITETSQVKNYSFFILLPFYLFKILLCFSRTNTMTHWENHPRVTFILGTPPSPAKTELGINKLFFALYTPTSSQPNSNLFK